MARAEIIYNAEGKISGVRHAWTFDEGFSSYLSQGLDTNKDGKLSREELSGLAKENVESLTESNYFTVAKANGKPIEVAPPTDYYMESDGKQLTMYFVLPLKTPMPGRVFSIEVYDPNYFIAFVLAQGDSPITLKDAPKGCTVSFQKPKAIDDGSAKSESFWMSLPQGTDFGAQFSGRAVAACP
ncbi:DUF1007 family protein [Terrarubrum flagellatum]|uniref:DUF1007 family protein n=1 Tax=Terrirubrum flagellatum TaxID=2895980 RepID=UPI00314502B2